MTPRWLRALWRSGTGRFGIIVVLVIAVTALVSLFWTPFNPLSTDLKDRWAAPGWPHLLGTDGTGRDILSLIMTGARTTVFVSVGAAIIATVVGILLAALGALTARWMRETIAVLGVHLAQRNEPLRLAAIHVMTSLTGSALLALAVDFGELDGEAAWAAGHVDEDWQVEHWGQDAEAVARRSARKRDMMAAVGLLDALKG